jgi:hypothetical protein
MSRGAGFTDNRCNDQETANLRGVQAGAPFKSTLANFEHDFGRARDILTAAINEAAEDLGVFGYRFPDPEEDPKDADWTSRYQRSIRAIIQRHADMDEAIDVAFADYDWSITRALREFRQAIARETAP